MNDKRIVAVYCRVSTEIQRERETINTQKKRLGDFCERQGFNPFEQYVDDGFSGGDLDRPEMTRLLNDIRNGKVGTVLVTEPSRLSRDSGDNSHWIGIFEEFDIEFYAINYGLRIKRNENGGYKNPILKTGNFISESERDNIRNRVSFAMYQRTKEGKWNGGVVPFGYTTFHEEVKKLLKQGMHEDDARPVARKTCKEEKKLYVYEPEANAVRFMFDTYLQTHSVRKVRDALHEKRFWTREGQPWTSNSLSRILQTPVYIGKVWYGKRTTPVKGRKMLVVPKKDWLIKDGQHQGIVANEVFNKVQEILQSKKQVRVRFDTVYKLAGQLKCGNCGGSLQGKSSRKPDGTIHSYYRCYTRDQKGLLACTSTPIRKNLVETCVSEAVIDFYNNLNLMGVEDVVKRHNQYIRSSEGLLREEIQKMSERNEKIKKKKTFLFEAFEEQNLTASDFKQRMQEINGEFTENEEKLKDFQNKWERAKSQLIDAESVYVFARELRKLWNKSDEEQRKGALKRFVRKVTYKDLEHPLEATVVIPVVGDNSRKDRGSWPQRARNWQGM
ncbi:MAG TPA: recombinase family protein [Candidatus Omnitrophota bacterium]|nr:recombinase family protein [Candidatus Omnitrophota bacterium]